MTSKRTTQSASLLKHLIVLTSLCILVLSVMFLRSSDTHAFHAHRPINNSNTSYYDTFKRHPPPNFEQWILFANQRNCSTRLKDYAVIYEKLDTWMQRGGIPAEKLNAFEEHWDFKVLQFVDGGFTGDERFLEGRRGLFDAVEPLLKGKDFRFVLNQLDEPVAVPADDSWLQYSRRNLSEETVMRHLFGNSKCFRERFGAYSVAESPEWAQLDSGGVDVQLRVIVMRHLFGNSKCFRERFGAYSVAESPEWAQLDSGGVEYVHSFMQQPAFYDTKVRNTDIPVFSQCTTACHSDVPIPLRYHVETARNPPKDVVLWEDKKRVVFWRGSTTGGRYIVGAPWRMYHRTRLLQWGLDYGEKHVNSTFDASVSDAPNSEELAVDVGFHAFTQQDAVTEVQLLKEYGMKGLVSLEASLQFKYLIVVDGYAWPSRLQQYLASNSVVLYNGIFLDFFNARLKPWVHYVPFRLDYSDLEERLVWLMENDEAARRISENARKLMEGVNRMEFLECYTGLLFLEYSHLYDKAVVEYETVPLKGIKDFTYGKVRLPANSTVMHTMCSNHVMIVCVKSTDKVSDASADDFNVVLTLDDALFLRLVAVSREALNPVIVSIYDPTPPETVSRGLTSSIQTGSGLRQVAAEKIGEMGGEILYDQVVDPIAGMIMSLFLGA
ncbi:glycosyl transferase family 90-domain-containing protein [Chytriomyces cf. hyalinus JEL632]|nr:glycosyl transferase family 90-domain-containing protein [Chytriomyces cf. hyalinus JEL632]